MLPQPNQKPIPDLPPVLSLGGVESGSGLSRGLTASTASTATPANANGAEMNLGGDFGSMFKSFEKRGSTSTLTLANQDSSAPRSLTGNRYVTPGSLSPGPISPGPISPGPISPGLISPDGITSAEPLLSQRNSPPYGDSTPTSPTSAANPAPPPVPRHEHLNSFKYSSRPADIIEDEDAKVLRESLSAMKFLSEPYEGTGQSRTRQFGSEPSAMPRTIASGFQKEENMFEGSPSRFTHTIHRSNPRASNQPGNKVMTPAQFEKYRRDKETGSPQKDHDNSQTPTKDEEDEDDVNYDDDEDELEKSRQQARQRRKQEAHMAVYRQQMMKVTGEANPTPMPVRQPARPGLVTSSTAPALGRSKAPSPDHATGGSSEEDDEDVPLAILQAHGFPHKTKPPPRLGPSGSNVNLRAAAAGASQARPASAMGDASSTSGRLRSNLPAFARNLPQDPFVGASIARPAIRESMAFSDATLPPLSQPQGPLPPGGLVGVIASEERSRAMRRGSPSIDATKMVGAAMNGNGADPFAAMPPQMMYHGAAGMPGMPGMPGASSTHLMPPQMLSVGDQAQIQMTQQMQQFMQMQMQFMQMMATNQNGAAHMPQQAPPHSLYGGGMPGNQSMGDLNRHSMMMDPMMEPRRPDPYARTMSMVQPSSASFMAPFQQGPPSVRGFGNSYTPSIAPSERSNVGLPGRYRPVSQAASGASPVLGQHGRSNTMTEGLSSWSDDRSKSTVKLMNNSREGSDDDEEQGWEAMKAKREKKRTLWRSKRSPAAELNTAF